MNAAIVPMTPLRAAMHRRVLDASAFKFAKRGQSAWCWLEYAEKKYPVAMDSISSTQLEAICAMSFRDFESSMELKAMKCRGAS